jgi:hypothetical protein
LVKAQPYDRPYLITIRIDNIFQSSGAPWSYNVIWRRKNINCDPIKQRPLYIFVYIYKRMNVIKKKYFQLLSNNQSNLILFNRTPESIKAALTKTGHYLNSIFLLQCQLLKNCTYKITKVPILNLEKSQQSLLVSTILISLD